MSKIYKSSYILLINDIIMNINQVFLISEVGADSFLERVEQFEETNCL